MSHAAILAVALLLDAALGEPDWLWSRLPHPAVLMGRAIDAADRAMNRGSLRRLKGLLALLTLASLAALLAWAITLLPLSPLWQALAAAILIAQRSLAQHVAAVATALRTSTEDGRRAVARISFGKQSRPLMTIVQRNKKRRRCRVDDSIEPGGNVYKVV
jgi:adenosylcobinamide-phosphate synthase